jgi:hypothetical protein
MEGARTRLSDKGKPPARVGRKATGLIEPAGPPQGTSTTGTTAGWVFRPTAIVLETQ